MHNKTFIPAVLSLPCGQFYISLDSVKSMFCTHWHFGESNLVELSRESFFLVFFFPSFPVMAWLSSLNKRHQNWPSRSASGCKCRRLKSSFCLNQIQIGCGIHSRTRVAVVFIHSRVCVRSGRAPSMMHAGQRLTFLKEVK